MVDIKLYCGDCLEVLKTIDAKSIDAVVTDPPFFTPATHYQSRVKWQRKWADMMVLVHWWGLICDALLKVTKENGHVLAFCNADSYPAFYPSMYDRWEKIVNLVWDKDRPGLGRIWRHSHELIIAARNSGSYEVNDGKLRSDVIRNKATLSRKREHPVEKPPEMISEIISAVCPSSGYVLDPFMGSGTTGIACIQTGRNFIGIEIDKNYFDIAQKRIQEAQQKLMLPGL